ncbi:MAG TPA: aspartate 1-decarboxylase [Actinomycetota bacterium]|nr:aspartate 1-decarboxylase [Actinomycetota bacterium]
MRRTMMKSKIHRATVTGAELAYEGSLAVDRHLMDAADLHEYEKVQVVDVNNGNRFETYVIEAPAGSGVISLQGGAARLGEIGDKVIIMSFGSFEAAELASFEPIVVHVDDDNALVARLEKMGV